jgi:flagellar basal-body rod protein FlgG
MNNAVYAATTGLLNRARALDATANNLANAGVAGFKREELITTTFNDQVMLRMEDGVQTEIGTGNHGAIGDEIYVDITQGSLETTGRTLDAAIAGDGFFAVQDPNGANGMTRNGSFQIDANGYLTTSSGAFVIGQNGRIQLDAGTVAISETGEITVNGQNAGQLLIVVPQANTVLEKQANGLFVRPAGNGQFQGRILQGTLERANVDMIEEMTDMMASSRAFQSCGQVIRILDQVNQKTVNEIGRY